MFNHHGLLIHVCYDSGGGTGGGINRPIYNNLRVDFQKIPYQGRRK